MKPKSWKRKRTLNVCASRESGVFRDALQIMQILKKAESGIPIVDLCRSHGMSSAGFYKWRSKYGGMDVSMISQLKAANSYCAFA